MKKFNLLVVVFAALTLLLAACGGDDKPTNDTTEESDDVQTEDAAETEVLAYEPKDVDEETDVCEVCGMAILDNEHATQIVLQNERSLMFDDLGCLYEWKAENGEDDIGAEFVRDFHTKNWIQVKNATFVYDEEIATPMAYGVISFENLEDAETYIEEEGKGEILDAAALANHEWKMNEDMMDHDHHDHGDHDHDHGDHDHDEDDEHDDHDDHGHDDHEEE
ncbi:nitrous oxide reductase accessory protein NosL [Pseudogracilibacillus auburnensis]|uniref:nitrous oxide reductase accessory protein NosL n=1 Tax=Pseudogracilibacillus auburnensis TaxID=1494959 RepID=UPI001A963384|nr:nitrous oxide reductase accessory protein NosL [Pseudogracilibacillus auburnensis]MBO1002247.1 nitrous oxide reductase accessory protein NosL [Pseudogracilibacillus auburnensis]